MAQLTHLSQHFVLPHGKQGRGLWYVPYPHDITPASKGKLPCKWHICFHGGEAIIDLRTADTVLLYGASDTCLPLTFFHAAADHHVSISIQRAHATPIQSLIPGSSADRNDILSKQIRVRDDGRRSLFVARTLVVAKHESQAWLRSTGYRTGVAEARKAKTLAALRIVEAAQARRYFRSLFPDSSRRDSVEGECLDAAVLLLRGVIRRWILAHHLSPHHGFLHEPTTYESLVFDLVEPYRAWAEQSVHACAASRKKLTPKNVIEDLKLRLDEVVFCVPTRQWVRRMAFLQGAVLALRAYLTGDMLRLILPFEGEPGSGRPYKTSYRLAGELSDPR